ncbi:MAG TPA: hypothetical protein VFW40_04805, partial [Capsulimonadaceae bacterium]|nr:hypothetical protein [Capsulimonadaceae bacterium]
MAAKWDLRQSVNGTFVALLNGTFLCSPGSGSNDSLRLAEEPAYPVAQSEVGLQLDAMEPQLKQALAFFLRRYELVSFAGTEAGTAPSENCSDAAVDLLAASSARPGALE